jgi:hypothetical protein
MAIGWLWSPLLTHMSILCCTPTSSVMHSPWVFVPVVAVDFPWCDARKCVEWCIYSLNILRHHEHSMIRLERSFCHQRIVVCPYRAQIELKSKLNSKLKVSLTVLVGAVRYSTVLPPWFSTVRVVTPRSTRLSVRVPAEIVVPQSAVRISGWIEPDEVDESHHCSWQLLGSVQIGSS